MAIGTEDSRWNAARFPAGARAGNARPLLSGTALVLAVAVLLKLALHATGLSRYGYFRDELYYLASTEHLAAGYVEHPPLSIWLLAGWKALFGASLPAIRLFGILAGSGTVIATGLLARHMRGGLFAQGCAALCIAVAPMMLGVEHFYSMNAFEHLFWALAGLLFLRALEDGPAGAGSLAHAAGESRERGKARPGRWLILGVVLGLGLLNKFSILWLILGFAVGLLATRHRRVLGRPWPWLAAATAALLFLPFVIWQVRSGLPVLEFMRNAAANKNVHDSIAGFLMNQAMAVNVLAVPVVLAGIASLGLARTRPWSVVPIVFLTVALLLIAVPGSKPYYLASAYPFVLAPGAVVIEHLLRGRWGAWLRAGYAVAVLAGGLAALPLVVPVLPVDRFLRFSDRIGVSPSAGERHALGPLPQQFADMHGWKELAENVARVYASLPPEERAQCAIFAQNYGEAGAIDVLGRPLGLPAAICGHNSYWFWGPRGATGSVVIVIGGDASEYALLFDTVERVGESDHPLAMPYERHLPIHLCRGMRQPLGQLWPQVKSFG